MFTREDARIIHSLARRVKEISELPLEEKKRDMWRKHTSLAGCRPPVFVSPEGSWTEMIPEESLLCTDAFAREAEYELRKRIFRHEYVKDDTPVECAFDIPVSSIPINEGWGLTARRIHGTERGSWRFQPVVEKLSDWKGLKQPKLVMDEKGADEKVKMLGDAAGEYLSVSKTGIKIFDFHIAHIYCDFRGLDNMLVDLIDEENMVEDVFSFIKEGLKGLVDEALAYGLITANNDYTYHYSGGLGYTNDFSHARNARVGLEGVWAASEAQEFSCVSPEMFARFILPHERELLAPFGLNGYGCCDDLTDKLESVLTIKNLRRVAACPWANLKKMADRLKKDYILTWKPNPAYLAAEKFDEINLKKYLTQSLMDAKSGYPEIILRDTHTCRGEKERFTRFVEIAREAIDSVYAC
ncbi:MAG: hypothetical protein IJC48_06685 [Clostridia bacterium]|nr:hypothetical protein [Clostridia bacterium]